MGDKHVHDVGSGTLCACGWELKIPRYSFSVEIFDGVKVVASDAFNCSDLLTIADRLREVADELERGERAS